MPGSNEPRGPAECGLNQNRVDGCQLRSGRGSRTHTSSENRSNAGRWPSNSEPSPSQTIRAEVRDPATLKVGRGLGTESPGGGVGVEAAKPPEPPPLLDSSKHNCNKERRTKGRYCGQWTLAGPVKDASQFAYHRLRCKSYACPRCGPRKACYLRNRIAEVATAQRLQRLVILTLDPRKLPANLTQPERVEYLRERWRRMRVYLQRKLGRSAVFISVLEFQRNGNPHLHILIDSYLPKEWLLRSWQALGGGYTDIRFVDLHRVAAYLSKYMAKEWLDDFPEKCRRITASRGIVLFGRSSTKRGWVLFRQSITWFRETARMRQLVVADEGHTEEDGARQLVRFVADGWIE